MAKLIYATPTSLDGYIADDGNYEWSVPDDEVHAFICDILRPIGTYLYGRKTYETMAVWETPDVIPGLKPFMLDFARIWQNRLFQIAGHRRYSKEPARAGIRPAGGSRPEGSVTSRRFGGGRDARRTGDPGRTRRRVSSVRRACDTWWRQTSPAR
jgi:hypothetical protein